GHWAGPIRGGLLRPRERPAPDRIAARLRRSARRLPPEHPLAIPADAISDKPAGREGNRRKRLDRRAADDSARRTRCTGAVRRYAPRYAADAAKDLDRDPWRTRRGRRLIDARHGSLLGFIHSGEMDRRLLWRNRRLSGC